ncbi:MAG: thioredoxin domain-containing protein [Clostridia bacterium]|nr:thioredoxin domain-containing protein [Clostridia bacterium]
MTYSTIVTNRLANEKSPYLLQHANNPVAWYPWSEEAFAKAKAEDKPIFLSIGYSTCHWCHVMERESFEDEAVAAILNDKFISIKVDREERPDVDTIYMSVCTAMTGHGGWPLTIVMTPDKKPFFAGTYFPKESKYGMPGIMEILIRIATAWEQNREALLESGEKIVHAIETSYFASTEGELTMETLHKAYTGFERKFDSQYGGFGKAPKFPTPHNLSFLLRYWKMTGEAKALEMVEKTLLAMYQGGIYDHLGFGFSRYSTDRQWLVPHFEKMLYDNALLAIAYTEAFQATGKEEYARVVREIFTYVLQDMTSPDGAFYSAEDADSEGEEGKFYVWSSEEVKEVLGEESGEKFCQVFDITPQGNFEGKSIPNLINTGLVQGFDKMREKLFQHREGRVHPYKDDKLLTAWNGLMIAALALGSRALGEPNYAQAAEKSTEFIMKYLRREDGRLLARYREGEAAYPAYVDDYAFLIWGLIELYQATYKTKYLIWALELNDDLLKFFWDDDNGGLYQYGSDAEQLITRPKEIYDGAIPSGNSVATLNFLRLAHLTGEMELEEKARAQFRTFGGTVNEHPMGYSHLLMGLYFHQSPVTQVTIVGDSKDAVTGEMISLVNDGFAPEVLLMVKTEDTEGNLDTGRLTNLAGREAVDGKATAYICRNFTCQPPTTEPSVMAALLSEGERH